MARLPIPGSDGEQWGNLLNDFLLVAHNADGTLRNGGSLWVNVKAFGALGNADSDPESEDTTAIQAAINSLTHGGVVYFPPGAYRVKQPNGLLFANPQIVLQGSARATSRIVAGTGCTYLVQTQLSPAVRAVHVEVRDLTLDGNFTCLGLLSVNGSVLESVTVQRCEFRKFLNGVLLGDVQNALIDRCVFNNFGAGSGTALYIGAGSANCVVTDCRFLWCSDGILVDAGNGDNERTVQNITVERNYFDLGWYTLPAKFSGNGSYTTSSLNDPAGAFTSRGVAEGMYFRAMSVQASGTVGTTSSPTLLVDPAAAFPKDTSSEGELIEVTGAGYQGFAVIARVVNATQIQVEEWLDQTTRQPLPAPPAGATYTIYKVYLGRATTAITDTSVGLNNNRWFDLNGQEHTPDSGTRYDLLPRPNYPIHMTGGVRNVKIYHNTVKRGYSDQISYWGDQAIISGNHLLWGQDMGITLNGAAGDGHSTVTENFLYKSGAGGIWTSAEHATIAHNVVKATTWVNSLDTNALGGIILAGAKHVAVVGNICNGQNLPHAYAGIVLWEAQNVTLAANRVHNVSQFAVKVVGNQVSNLQSTQEAPLTASLPIATP